MESDALTRLASEFPRALKSLRTRVNTRFRKNTWVELGVYRFTGMPRVVLTNTTDDGTADEDVAWDAVAFQPLSGKPKHMVVAMGDSYTSGEGAGAYLPESDRDHGDSDWNACRRSPNAWPRKVTLPGQTKSIGALADSFDPAPDFQFTACSGAKTFQTHGCSRDPHGAGTDPCIRAERDDLADGVRLALQPYSGVLDLGECIPACHPERHGRVLREQAG